MAKSPRYGDHTYGSVIYNGTFSSVYAAPPAPSPFTGTSSASGVTLTWDSIGSISYTLERSSDGGVTYTTLATGITNNSYLDSTAVLGGNVYYYRITGFGLQGLASAKSVTSVTTSLVAVPAVGYLYKNVGIIASGTVDINGIQYLYKNVGVGPRWPPDLMRVVARFTDQYGVGYLYKNVT